MDKKIEIIEKLCRVIGVAQGYYDVWGTWHQTSLHTKEAILEALGFPLDTAEALDSAARQWFQNIYNRFVAPTVVLRQPCLTLPVRLPGPGSQGRIRLTVFPETAEVVSFSVSYEDIPLTEVQTPWGTFYEGQIRLPVQLPLGYHTLVFEENSTRGETLIVVVPDRAVLPEGPQMWGLSLSLYGLCSEKSQGIGDLGVLRQLTGWVSAQGGRFVLINPLHYNDSKGPSGRSPYYPLSRVFFNPLYIDLSELPWLRPSELKPLKTLEEGELIEYERVFAAKDNLLRVAFGRFLNQDLEDRDFKEFCDQEGPLLEEFARYAAERTSSGAGPQEVLYQKFLQWCLWKQIEALPDGVVFDLALGTREDGFDPRAFEGALVKGISVGAPPDDFSPRGQDWGFPPLSPLHLQQSGYRYLITLLRKNIPQGGGIRIDHIAGLQRLFWIPRGAEPRDGTYVYCPMDELLGVVCLESRRKNALVIGEDLGTVEPALRQEMSRRDILSFRVFYFEKEDNSYREPGQYPDKALVTTTTHDLPTLWGFYSGQDIQDRLKLDRYPDRAFYERDLAQRARDIDAIRAALKKEGLMQEFQERLTLEELIAIYRFLRRTPCKLVALQMDDLLQVSKQQNMPGTVQEYPNWQRRYPLRMEDALERLKDLIGDIMEE